MCKQTTVLHDPYEAAELLRRGGVVAFPTETVYGLGASALDPIAIEGIFKAKGRPSDNPLIVHLDSANKWSLAAREISESAELFLKAFSPGPLTVVLPRQQTIAPAAVGGLDTVGLRIPALDLAREFLSLCRVPVAAPSANRSGKPSCTTWQSVVEDLDGRIDAVLVGPNPEIGVESSVVDCTGDAPVLLRPGGVSLEQLQRVVPATCALASLKEAAGHSARSPGLQHPHYQPDAPVVLVTGDGLQLANERDSQNCVFMGLTQPAETTWLACHLFDSIEQYAHKFYETLRSADRAGAACIYVQLVEGDNSLVSALRDRQLRSAQQ